MFGLAQSEDMKGPALFNLVAIILSLLSPSRGLSLEKTVDSGTDTTEEPHAQDDSDTDDVVRVNNGIRFENGIPIYDILASSTTRPSDSEKIVFDEELEALKVMEMLTGDGGENKTSSPLFSSGNVTIEEYHSYQQVQTFVRDLVFQYPDLVTNYSVGKSVQDRDLIALKIRS